MSQRYLEYNVSLNTLYCIIKFTDLAYLSIYFIIDKIIYWYKFIDINLDVIQ